MGMSEDITDNKELKEDRAALYLKALSERVVVFDGAMGTSIQKYNLSPDDFGGHQYEGCNDYLSITKPEIIEEIHRSFLEVGADVVETNTFRSNRITLGEYGLDERVHEINVASAQIARCAADEFSTPEKPRFVAGSIGPSGKLPSSSDPTLSDITWKELVEVFKEQATCLLTGGVDVLLIETSQDILEVKAAVEGLKLAIKTTGIKAAIQAQVTLDITGRMLLGTDIGATHAIIESMGIDVIGLNCSTGPDYMSEPIRYLTSHTRLPVSAVPNAGLPKNVDGEAVYPMEPEPMAQMLSQFVTELGCNIVGGCCGTTPEHIRLLHDSVAGKNPWKSRPPELDLKPRIASAMEATELDQEPRPLFVGERVNSQGSRRVKELLLEDNYDAILEIAHRQVEAGAHALDVCVALTERTDEDTQMQKLIKMISQAVSVPAFIDSTETAVVKAALETYPGRAVVNSINLENGLQKIEEILPLVKKHGAAVIALTIDEEGMAHTGERKFNIAKRIYEIATGDYGLSPHELIFDVLTFPVTTGQVELRNSAIETLEGIQRVKEALPGAYTILGLSNVSFGLAQLVRRVINSVFLHHAVEAGLDMAILNPADITPYMDIPEEERELVDDLLFNRTEDALPRVITYYEESADSGEAAEERADPTEGMGVNEKIHWQVVHRKKEGIEELIDKAVKEQDAVWVLNRVLLPAMKEVGDKFGTGELILPFVLQSAEVMKKAVARLETYLERKEGTSKGTLVLATVFGDVHDIGKNLVGTILSNNGYTVIDLGKQVPVNTIIDAAIKHSASAIGLSALLVSTSKQMPICVRELHNRGLEFPVIVGGAAIHRRFGYRILFMDDGNEYSPGVFYCKDAFEGLDAMDKLISDEAVQFVEKVKENARRSLTEEFKEKKGKTFDESVSEAPVEPSVKEAKEIPKPENYGVFIIDPSDIDIHKVVRYFDLDTLFRLHWGGRGKKGAEWEKLLETTFRPTLKRFEERLANTAWLSYRVVYGIFPAASKGEEVIIYDSQDEERVLARWSFPRQPEGRRLCLSDYFVPERKGRDFIGLQIVTSGPEATEEMEKLQLEQRYTEAYYLNGFANQLAEGLAEWTHRRLRHEMNIPEGQGLRYSWGYPACPDLSQQTDVIALLNAGRIGVSLTEAHQLVPEQSTAALVVHHPEAIYFSTGVEKAQREEAIREVLGELKVD